MKKYLPYLAGMGMATIFGFSFLFTKNALGTLGTVQLPFLRFLTAFIFMTFLVIFKVIKVDYRGKNVLPLMALAMLEPVIYFVMETNGLKYTTASEAGVMIAFIPVVVTILGVVLLKEKTNKLQGIFVLLSVAGVLIIVLADGKAQSGGTLKGILFLLGAVLCASFYTILARKVTQNFTTYEITYFMMFMAVVFFGVMNLITGIYYGNLVNTFKINKEAFISILFLGVLSSVVAYSLVNYSLSKLPAFQSSVFSNLTTVVSVIAGVIFRNEAFGAVKIIGTILVIIGVFGTNCFSKPMPPEY